MIRHHETFSGSGSLDTASFWSLVGGGVTWTKSNGYCDIVGSFNIDSAAIHGTDANLGLPASHNVGAQFSFESGAKTLGVFVMGDATGMQKVELRWWDNYGHKLVLKVPGFADQVVSAVGIASPVAGLRHTIGLGCAYQGKVGGFPSFIFYGFLNGQGILQSPPRTLSYWDSAKYHVGLTARRETFGVPNPVLRVHEFASELPQPTATHEPKPTVTAKASRSPITISDEKPSASPAVFPFEVRIASVAHKRHTRKTLTDMGYAVTSPKLSNARRIISCSWIGSDADAATLESFIDAREGSTDNFTITIRALGIGTIDAAFLSIGAFIDESNGYKRISFTIAELF